MKDRGRGVIFVGGTPMFLKGVLRGFDPGPPADWEFRRSVEVDIERHGVDALRERLRQVDPLAAHRIGPNDTRRMIRALEVARHTGTPISHRQVQFDSQRDAESCNVFSLQWPRHQLHERINSRVAQMFDRGLVDEIRGLLQQYGGLSRTASQAVGYREIIDWLGQGGALQGVQGGALQGVQGGALQGVQGGALEGVIEEVAAHTRQLARRQETWFRSFTEIRAIDVNQPIDPNEVADRIHGMLVDSPSPSGQ